MASERDPPLTRSSVSEGVSSRRRCFCPASVRKRYENICVSTTGGLVAQLLEVVLFSLGFPFVLSSLFIPTLTLLPSTSTALSGFFITGYFLRHAVSALVDELRWTRLRPLCVRSVFVVAMVVNIVIWSLAGLYFLRKVAFFFSFLLLAALSLGAVHLNILLHFARSEIVSNLMFWLYWTYYLFPGIAVLLNHVIAVDDDLVLVALVLVAEYVLVLSSLIAVCCCCYNPEVVFDRDHHLNKAVKLIWKVSRFALKNKNPTSHSVFTYGEAPSQLDVAKQKYGGPFSMCEVEGVKSFWQLSVLILSLVGFQLRDDITFLPVTLLELEVFGVYVPVISLGNGWSVSSVVIIVCIPIYQLIIRPYFARYIPRMLTRMTLGLLAVLISLLVVTTYTALVLPDVVHVYYNNTTHIDDSSSVCLILKGHFSESFTSGDPVPHVWWLVVAQALNGLAHLLVFLTVVEFILAQAPRIMWGLLIGLWFAMLSVNLGTSGIGYFSCAVFHWAYYATKSFLVFVSIVLFIVVLQRYKHWKLKEEVDINMWKENEDALECNFDREFEFKQEKLHHDSECIVLEEC